ncbi:hypothetical protein NLX71_03300 [Paenibacillus sp. MZ04-78.2]|nr:hypothetical protein [Paenibacillus sp. MZ04-78.2]MCP3772341.1 hypothetical protein [Paenibacillus sp. MZ04-78.2]
MDNQFSEERSDDLKTEIAAAVDPVPSLTVEASPQSYRAFDPERPKDQP